MDEVMEKKLAEYRLQKQRDERFEATKQKLRSIFTVAPKEKDSVLEPPQDIEPLLLEASHETCSMVSDKSDSDFDDTSLNCCTWVDYLFYGLMFLLWVTLYAIFIKLQFGAIYFILSALIGIYLNTSTKKRRKNQKSAYSVFNKNCESIDGTLKAEQFERELYGRK